MKGLDETNKDSVEACRKFSSCVTLKVSIGLRKHRVDFLFGQKHCVFLLRCSCFSQFSNKLVGSVELHKSEESGCALY